MISKSFFYLLIIECFLGSVRVEQNTKELVSSSQHSHDANSL